MSDNGTSVTILIPQAQSPARSSKTQGHDDPRSPRGRGLNATFRSLRHRNYRLYFIGQIISLTGTWMQSTVVLWLAFDLTHQSKWPALVTAAAVVPTFLLGAWAGNLADRWPKRSIIFATQVAFALLAFVLAGLVYFQAVTPWQLLLVTVVSGMITAVDLPARLAFVLDMVGREDLMNAVALNSLLFNVARAAGPALGGLMLVWLGAWPCFFVNGLSYLAVLWALWQMDINGSAGIPHDSPIRPRLFDGFRYLSGHPELAFLTLLAGCTAFCGWPTQSLLPALAAHVLEAGEREYSWMLSATGMGALLAAWVVATFGSVKRRHRMVGLGVVITVIGLILLAMSPLAIFAVGACGLIGFGLILVLATSQSIIQLSTSEHNRGRIMGIWAMVLSGAVPIGNLIAGPLADAWSEPFILWCLGLLYTAASLCLLLFFKPWKFSRRFSMPARGAEQA